MSINCTTTVYWLWYFISPITCSLCDTENGRVLFSRQLSSKFTVITQKQGILCCFTKTITNISFSGILLICTDGIGPVSLTLCVDGVSCLLPSKWFCFPQKTKIFRISRLYSADECSMFFASDNIW